jgi:hypothetical protein
VNRRRASLAAKALRAIAETAEEVAMRRKSIALALGASFLLSAGSAVAEPDYFDDDGCGGTISCSAETVGDVIALPFRVIGDVVDFIF